MDDKRGDVYELINLRKAVASATGVPLITAVVVLFLISGVVWLIGASNPFTPAGYMGYLTKGAVFGKAKFYGIQKGPVSAGRTWLLSVINVSITPYTYSETFSADTAVLSKDNLKISFAVHTVWKVKPDEASVKEFVEKYSTIGLGHESESIVKNAYANFLKEPLRTYARDEIQRYNGLEIKDRIAQIGSQLTNKVKELTAKTPFEVTSIVVGNIQYPDEVANAVSLKLKTTQDLERKKTEIDIERQEKEKRIVQAEGIAKSMEIINLRLTSQYLQHEAIEAQRAMVGSPNHTTICVPVGPMGVPIVGTMDLSGKGKGTGSSPPKEKP